MPRPQELVASSIQQAILNPEEKPTFIGRVPGYFYIYSLPFQCLREDLFKSLRIIWHISDEDYESSFGKGGKKGALKSMGDMGYSGSTFFSTADSKYLVKSVPRHFEHSFFKNDMLVPYSEYMHNSPWSLLVRITDFLECVQHSFGSLMGLTPSHHIVMENIMCSEDPNKSSDQEENSKWESWDLKPMSYFYPERDVAGGVLSSEATKSKLADDFNEKIVLDRDQAEAFKGQLEKDTALLRTCNAVDYSLFLVRIPNQGAREALPEPFSWRTGIESADGEYVYRASILDFFWAKHKVHAKAMTGLIKSYNIVDRQGPMSVTTTADEYRERFLKMCTAIIAVKE